MEGEKQQLGRPFFGCSISWQLSSAPGESGRGSTEGWGAFLPLEFAGLGSKSGTERLKD